MDNNNIENHDFQILDITEGEEDTIMTIEDMSQPLSLQKVPLNDMDEEEDIEQHPI